MRAIFWAQTVLLSPSYTPRKSKSKIFAVMFELHLKKSSFFVLLKLLSTWLSQFCAITNEIIFRRLSFYYSHLPNFIMVEFELLKAAANLLDYFSSIKNDSTCVFFSSFFPLFVWSHAMIINSLNIFFTCFVLLVRNIPSHKFHMINGFWITIVKVFIIVEH